MQTNAAITQMIKAMQIDCNELLERIDLAADDIGAGRRNSAIGALAIIDDNLERIAAMLSACRAIHRMAPF